MPFIPAPNIVELQFRTTWAGEQTMNRVMVNVLTAPTEAICASLAALGAQWWLTNVQTLVSDQLALREVYAKSIATQPGPEATFSSGLPANGTNVNPSLPNNVSIAVSLRTGLTGRSARGRWYWQGLTENQVVNSVVDAGVASSIVATLDNLLSTIDGAGYDLSIVSFFSGGIPRPGGPVYFAVNDALVVDGVVDSQRRRLPGRGR